jgi:hypothetical protein
MSHVVGAIALIVLIVLPTAAAAQDAQELARQTQNPVANLISVPFQGNWDVGIGDRETTSTLLNFQPVVPFSLTPRWNAILRVIVPLTSVPAGDARANGVADTVATLFLTPPKPGKLIWGVGPALLLPTATSDALGSEQVGLGPSVVALTQTGSWTVGVLFNHIWSVGGAVDRPDVDQTFLQPFANYNIGDGLAVGITSEASANWNNDEAWTVPLLFSASKVTALGKRPVNLLVAAGPYIAHPSGTADWRVRFAAVFLFPR